MRSNVALKKISGYIFTVGGVLSLLVSFYSALSLYYIHERVLFFIPSLSQDVTTDELADQPGRFDGKWISIRGELQRRTEEDALLVTPGSGLAASADKGANQANSYQLYIHNFSVGGIRTLSALEVPRNQPVTVVGEFEKENPVFGRHLDAVAIISPRQNELRAPMVRNLISYSIRWLLSIFLAFFGWMILKSTRREKGYA